LEHVVFQEKLGSLSDKSRRLEEITVTIAELQGEDGASLRRAAQLSKCDLVSQMVGEFPELQGTMGGYYALASGESEGVSMAIKEHYAPRFSGDSLPASQPGRILALADRLDTLVGIFAAGLKPTGNKDPFALRRAALGLVRLLTETGIDIDLGPLLETAANALEDQLSVSDKTLVDVHDFIVDRARQMFRDKGFDTRLVNAVLSARLTSLQDLESRLNALDHFMSLQSAESLVAANKRIGNILRKSGENDTREIEEDRLVLAEERMLFDEVSRVSGLLEPLFASREYSQALTLLAEVHPTINQFFDQVMVMDDDPVIRANRLALLGRLKGLFDRVADLSQAA
jgi:glycyl-tRNA synthetase beta chain